MINAHSPEITRRLSGIRPAKAFQPPPPRKGSLAAGLTRLPAEVAQEIPDDFPLDSDNFTKATVTRNPSYVEGHLRRTTEIAEHRRQSGVFQGVSPEASFTNGTVPRQDSSTVAFGRQDSVVSVPLGRQPSVVASPTTFGDRRESSVTFTRQTSSASPNFRDPNSNRRLSIIRGPGDKHQESDTVSSFDSIPWAENTVTHTRPNVPPLRGYSPTEPGRRASPLQPITPIYSPTMPPRKRESPADLPRSVSFANPHSVGGASASPVFFGEDAPTMTSTISEARTIPNGEMRQSSFTAAADSEALSRFRFGAESPAGAELPRFGRAPQDPMTPASPVDLSRRVSFVGASDTRTSTPNAFAERQPSITSTPVTAVTPDALARRTSSVSRRDSTVKRLTTARRTSEAAVRDGPVDPAQAALDRAQRNASRTPFAWQELLGPELLAGVRRVPTNQTLGDADFVALYFAAGSSPPCIDFAKTMKSAYAALQTFKIELVFVSSDKSLEAFRRHYEGMPWKAVPWRTDLYKIDERYGVLGVPKLIVLHPDGSVATSYGAQLLREDLSGEKLMDAVWENTADVGVSKTGSGTPRQRKRDKLKEECTVM